MDPPTPYGVSGEVPEVTPRPTENPVIAATLASAASGVIGKEAADTIRETPGMVLTAAQTNYQDAQKNLEQKLEGINPLITDAVLDNVFKNIQAGILNLPTSTFTGMSREQIQSIVPDIQNYSQALKGYNKVLGAATSFDDIGVAGKYAEHTVQLRLDRNQLDRDIEEAQKALQTLQQNPNMSADELGNINLTLGKIVPRLDFDKTKSIEQLRDQVAKNAKDARKTIDILNSDDVRRSQQAYDPSDPNSLPQLKRTVQIATQVEQLKKTTLADAAQTVDKQIRQAITQNQDPITITQNAEVIAKIKPQIQAVVEYSPTLREKAQSLDDQTREQRYTQSAQELVQELVTRVSQGTDSALGHVVENEGELRDWLTKKLQDGFSG